jgi:hypothetical protein
MKISFVVEVFLPFFEGLNTGIVSQRTCISIVKGRYMTDIRTGTYDGFYLIHDHRGITHAS